MKTLFVSWEPVVPADSGGRLRSLHLARQLARIATVDMAAPGEAGGELVGQPFTLTTFPHPVKHYRWLLGSAVRAYEATKARNRALADFAGGRLWDTAHAETPYMVWMAERAGVPVVMDAQNIESDLERGLATIEMRPPVRTRRRWRRWEAGKIERLERAVARRIAAVSAVSDHDVEAYHRFGARRVVLVPNGIDTERVTHRPPATGATLLYLGHFGYLPNVTAAVELAAEVLPRVRRSAPEATVQLVGKSPRPEVQAVLGPHVALAENVPDVVPYLHAARALVVPLRVGGGTRLKVLEAMAAGVPVVSTPVGVAGLDLRPGEDVLVGSTAHDLADQALRVIQDDELAARLSRNGRAAVVARYDWSIVTQPLLDLHQELAERHR